MTFPVGTAGSGGSGAQSLSRVAPRSAGDKSQEGGREHTALLQPPGRAGRGMEAEAAG